jgi:hypothetical protein
VLAVSGPLVSRPLRDRRERIAFIEAMTAIVEAFQEALDMRRAAYRRYVLNDE